MSIKRILSFLFVLVIISGIFVVSADAADVYEYTEVGTKVLVHK